MKVIAVDYDNTYSADPELFELFIRTAMERKHIVFIVTARPTTNPVPVDVCEVVYTDGALKAPFMKERFMDVDIWIDDWPEIIGPTQ